MELRWAVGMEMLLTRQDPMGRMASTLWAEPAQVESVYTSVMKYLLLLVVPVPVPVREVEAEAEADMTTIRARTAFKDIFDMLSVFRSMLYTFFECFRE